MIKQACDIFFWPAIPLSSGPSGNELEQLVKDLQRDDDRRTFKLQAKLQRRSIGQ